MPFDLQVHFEFLCAFAPPVPFDQGPKECYVVLPDLRTPPKEFDAHHACLLYKASHRVLDHLLPEPLVPRPRSESEGMHSGETREVIRLDREEIEIRVDDQAAPGSQLEVGSLARLLRIGQAEASLAMLDGELVESAAPQRVAARLHLRQGKLSEGEVTPEDFVVVHKDNPANPLHTGRIARRVTLQLKVAEHVDFVFRKLGDPPDEGKVLRLKTAASSTVVTIRNSEEKFVWAEKLPEYDDQSDSEMNLFFELAADFDPGAQPPKTLVQLKIQPETHNGVCAPKAFDGWK